MSTLTPSSPPARASIFNLPNQLTALRFLLSIVLFVLIALEDIPGRWWWALVVFVLAAITDFLDGYLARKLNLGSTLGRNFDPLVDKILICGAYVFLLSVPNVGLHPWMVVVVIGRELLVTSLRSFLENSGIKFGADWGGKLKMVLQCATLVVIFLYEALRGVPELEGLWIPRDVLIYAMVASTVLSGGQYLWKAAALLRPAE